jgi:hypothetical protein
MKGGDILPEPIRDGRRILFRVKEINRRFRLGKEKVGDS